MVIPTQYLVDENKYTKQTNTIQLKKFKKSQTDLNHHTASKQTMFLLGILSILGRKQASQQAEYET